MDKKPHSIEDMPRDNRGAYRVPDGYFSQLNHQLKEAPLQPVQGGVWATVRSMFAFVGSFAVMVVMAIVGFYFTGYQAQTNETTVDELYLFSLYDISDEDIMDSDDSSIVNSQIFADAAIDYLDTYGYNLTDILESEE